MGMTIANCLEKLAHEKQCFIDECYQNDGELEAYDMAFNIIQKYQNIEDVMKNYRSNPIDCLFRIRRILER